MTCADPPPVGLVLAAGAGRRMGGPKALVESDGERWVDRAARVLREGGCDPVVVVLGAAVVDVPGAIAVVADDWADGMGASLRRGLGALPGLAPDARACVVVLVDQPDLDPRAVAAVAAGCAVDGAAMASYAGTPGHPVALGRDTWAQVAGSCQGDIAARAWLAAHRDLVASVPCDGYGSAKDVDEPVS